MHDYYLNIINFYKFIVNDIFIIFAPEIIIIKNNSKIEILV
jgi:hypothetical protein